MDADIQAMDGNQAADGRSGPSRVLRRMGGSSTYGAIRGKPLLHPYGPVCQNEIMNIRNRNEA